MVLIWKSVNIVIFGEYCVDRKHRMEEVATELDSKFKDTEKRLDVMSWKVDQLVKNEEDFGQTLSATKLLAGLQEVKKEFGEVTKEVEQLRTSQQEAMASILQEFQIAMTAAEQLKEKLGDIPQEKPSPPKK